MISLLCCLSLVCVRATVCLIRDLSICQDDFLTNPPDGMLKTHRYTWLGFVQYIHVMKGLPHHSKVPRVILVHKQFVLGTATDLMHLPQDYRLGNVVFGDYERDEKDCGLTHGQIKIGITCPRALLEVPLIDITPHPEFTRFGVSNSLALVKLLQPMKSHYMVPVCLPSISERAITRKHKNVFMIDYINTVPVDFDTEKLAKKSLKLYTHRDCKRHRMKKKLGSEGITHVLCSSGCGVRGGAPIITHSIDGPYELIGVAVGGAPCHHQAMRRRLNNEPPLYIDVFPYITWIINIITAYHIPKSYSQNFRLVDAVSNMGVNKAYLRRRRKQKSGWRGRTFMAGNYCFKKMKKRKIAAEFFYSERFEVTTKQPTQINVIIKVSAGIECTIRCVRLTLPSRFSSPMITGLGGYNVTIEFDTGNFPYSFYFQMAMYGRNTTEKDLQQWLHERQTGYYW